MLEGRWGAAYQVEGKIADCDVHAGCGGHGEKRGHRHKGEHRAGHHLQINSERSLRITALQCRLL